MSGLIPRVERPLIIALRRPVDSAGQAAGNAFHPFGDLFGECLGVPPWVISGGPNTTVMVPGYLISLWAGQRCPASWQMGTNGTLAATARLRRYD